MRLCENCNGVKEHTGIVVVDGMLFRWCEECHEKYLKEKEEKRRIYNAGKYTGSVV